MMIHTLVVHRDDTEVILHSDDAFAPVKLLRLKGLSLKDKKVCMHEKLFCSIAVKGDSSFDMERAPEALLGLGIAGCTATHRVSYCSRGRGARQRAGTVRSAPGGTTESCKSIPARFQEWVAKFKMLCHPLCILGVGSGIM